jgi:hypothetical protein
MFLRSRHPVCDTNFVSGVVEHSPVLGSEIMRGFLKIKDLMSSEDCSFL